MPSCFLYIELDIQETTGHPPFGVDLKIVDDDGKEIEWDGSTQGDLYCKGAAVVKRYLKMDELAVDSDNWFNTGDVATIDKNGYMRITDRSKDVIKSGGEWISSIDLENAAVGHPDVAEAAAIGVPHPKWDERPFIPFRMRNSYCRRFCYIRMTNCSILQVN